MYSGPVTAEPYRDRPGCAQCGVAIELEAAQYADDGRQICSGCVERAELASGHARAVSATKGAAYVALGLALGGCVCGPLSFFLSLAALVVGIGAIGAARTSRAAGPGISCIRPTAPAGERAVA